MEITQENNLQEVWPSEDRVRKLYDTINQLMNRVMILQEKCLNTTAGVLNNREVKVIELIGRQRNCMMREIAENLSLAMSSTTLIVDRLVKNGYLNRERSEEDRRIVHVELTENGLIAYQEEKEKYMGLSRSMLRNLSDEEQMILIALLKKSYREGKGR